MGSLLGMLALTVHVWAGAKSSWTSRSHRWWRITAAGGGAHNSGEEVLGPCRYRVEVMSALGRTASTSPPAAMICYHWQYRDTCGDFAFGQICAVGSGVFDGLPSGCRFSFSKHEQWGRWHATRTGFAPYSCPNRM